MPETKFKPGDKIIWDSGFGYETGTFIAYTEDTMYNSVKVNLETGLCQGEGLRPRNEIKPYSEELIKELNDRFTFR